MVIYSYADRTNHVRMRLERKIKTSMYLSDIHVCRNVHSLTQTLRQPKHGCRIVVLLALTKEQLSRMFSIKDLFWDLRIVLILPDNEAETISEGHKFQPRYISYADSNFDDVVAVLKKMIEHLDARYAVARAIDITRDSGPEETAPKGIRDISLRRSID